MLIVDSQVHIWGANTPARPWPARAHPHRETPVGHEEMLSLMDAAGVHRAVIVPPSWEGDRNDLALAAAQAPSQVFRGGGRVARFQVCAAETEPQQRVVATGREQAEQVGETGAGHGGDGCRH